MEGEKIRPSWCPFKEKKPLDTNAQARRYGDIGDILTIVAIALTIVITVVRAIFHLAFPFIFCFVPGLIPVGFVIWLLFYAWFKNN